MTKKTRRRYSDEFKAEAVNMVRGEGYAISEAARRLDIDRSLLDRWCRQQRDREDGVTDDQADERDAEIMKLREEVRKLRIEKEVLKNCLGWSPACRVRNSAAAYTQPRCQRRSRRLFGGSSPLKNVVRAACWT